MTMSANGPAVPEHGRECRRPAASSRAGGGTKSTYTNSQSDVINDIEMTF
jgi:hypothetical protein